ncbi:MAG: hypothetical protein IH895_08955 [Planctomycetes bacterium]|nr:hypothetical protein [Planctomycetota bacterium]
MARIYAMLSAICSLCYLLGLVLGVVMLFFSWKIALVVLFFAVLAAPSAKAFDKAKLRAIYGRDRGNMLGDSRWEAGKPSPRTEVMIDSEAYRERRAADGKQQSQEQHQDS